MSEDRFETIQVGDEAEFSHVITVKDVDAFADLTGDDNPLHMDDSYAATTSFKKRVVHGMLTASFISTMIGTRLPGKGALWYEQNLKFLAPVRIGEEVRVWAKVRHKSGTQRIIVLETVVFGGDGRRVIEGEGKVKVLRPETQKKNKVEAMMEADRGAVVVTGSSRGIGAAIAEELARVGHPVVINCRSNEAEAQLVADGINEAGGRALAYRADVTDAQGVAGMIKAAADAFGEIAGVVNNASGPIDAVDFENLEWGDVQHHLDVQVQGAFNVCKAVMPYLNENGGSIVNVSSIFADNVPPAKLMPYVVAKSALNAMTKSLAADYGPKGVRVNTVSPGMTMTDLIADVPEKVKMVSKMQTPLRRLAEPADVSGLVAFLFGLGARHITGQNFRICGGSVMD